MRNSSFKEVFIRHIIKIIICFLAIFSLNLETMETKALTPNDASKLESGNVIVRQLTPQSNKIKSTEAKILIPSSPEKVWKILENQEGFPKFVPMVKAIKVLEKTNDFQKIQVALKVSNFLPLFKYTYVFDQSNKYKIIKFNRVNGCFRELNGNFELEPYQNKTLLIYRINIDPGFFVPDFIYNNGLNKNIPDFLNSIRNEAEKLSAK